MPKYGHSFFLFQYNFAGRLGEYIPSIGQQKSRLWILFANFDFFGLESKPGQKVGPLGEPDTTAGDGTAVDTSAGDDTASDGTVENLTGVDATAGDSKHFPDKIPAPSRYQQSPQRWPPPSSTSHPAPFIAALTPPTQESCSASTKKTEPSTESSQLFYQLLVLHAELTSTTGRSWFLPCICILLTHKDTSI